MEISRWCKPPVWIRAGESRFQTPNPKSEVLHLASCIAITQATVWQASKSKRRDVASPFVTFVTLFNSSTS